MPNCLQLKFRPEWTQTFTWAKSVSDPYKTYCMICRGKLVTGYQGRIVLKRHGETQKHIRNLENRCQMEPQKESMEENENELRFDMSDLSESESLPSLRRLLENKKVAEDQDNDHESQEVESSPVRYTSTKSPLSETSVKFSKVSVPEISDVYSMVPRVEKLYKASENNQLSNEEYNESEVDSPSQTVNQSDASASTIPISAKEKPAPKRKGRKRKYAPSSSCPTNEPKKGNDFTARMKKIYNKCNDAKMKYKEVLNESAKEFRDILNESKDMIFEDMLPFLVLQLKQAPFPTNIFEGKDD